MMEGNADAINKDFTIQCKASRGVIVVNASYPSANQFTTYACYLINPQTRAIIQRQMYQAQPEFRFSVSAGTYVVKVFISYKTSEEQEAVRFSKLSQPVEAKSKLAFPTVAVDYKDLEQLDLCRKGTTLYKIAWNGVTFDFAIHYDKAAKSAVVLGTGAIRVRTNLPAFNRISWAGDMPGCAIYYFDPTLYSNDIALCWCYGTNKRWYLENIAVILYKLLEKLNIARKDTLFFGSSGGGYTSMLLASMLHGRASVINPQFFLERYLPSWFPNFRKAVLRPGEELIPERISVTQLLKREGFFPPMQVWQNQTSQNDQKNQLLPFLKELVDSPLVYGGKLTVAFYYNEGGHNAMPSKEDCIEVIKRELARPAPCLEESGPYPKNSLLARMEAGEFDPS